MKKIDIYLALVFIFYSCNNGSILRLSNDIEDMQVLIYPSYELSAIVEDVTETSEYEKNGWKYNYNKQLWTKRTRKPTKLHWDISWVVDITVLNPKYDKDI